jgi:MFS family permease
VIERLRILEPLRERDFALFWSGWTVSLIGDGFFLVAIAWQVYDLWNDPTALALLGVAETLPLVGLLLVAGVLTDRLERRLVLIGSSALRGACVAVLGVLALSGAIELWHIFALGAVYGAGQAFQGPAAGAIVPDLVPARLLVQANSLSQVVRQLAFAFVGPALGGFVVHGLGPGTAFLVDAVSFGVAILALAALRPRAPAAVGAARTSMRREILEGLRFVRRHAWLWGTIAWALVALMLVYGPFEVLLPYLVRNELGGDAGDLGLVFASGGLGALLLSLAIGQLGLPRRHITFMYGAFLIASLQAAAYALTRAPWQAMAIAFVGEACWAAGLLVWVTLMQRVVPAQLLGRVKSVDWLVSTGLVPVSYAVTGPAAAWLGVKPVLFGAGIGAAALTVLFYFVPGMRDTEREGHAAHVVLSEAEPVSPAPVDLGAEAARVRSS